MASVGRATAVLASGTTVSRVLGFGRSWLLIQAVGATGFATDAYATATSAPNTIYAIIAQGVLNAVLIPQLVRAAKHHDGGQAYTNKLLSLGIVVFGVITIGATLLSPELMFLFGMRGAQAQLATAFAYWSLPQIFFYGLYSLLGEVLNARKSFGPFTWAPVLNNLVSIASLAVFIVAFQPNAHSLGRLAEWSTSKTAILAGGSTLGIAAQALILFLFWRGIGLKFRFDLRWRGMELGSVGRAAGWTFAMLLCTQLVGLFETNVANSASGGLNASSQALATMWLIFMLPHSIIAVSVVTAYFTRMAEHARDGDHPAFRADFSAATRGIILLLSICAAVLIVGAFPFSRIFTPNYTAFGNVLIAYLVGLVPFSVGFITLRAFYSLGDTRSPFVYTAVQSAIIAVGLCGCLFLPADIRAAGIALLVSIATIVQAILALRVLHERLGGIDVRGLARALVKGFIAAGVALAFGILVIWALGGHHAGGFAVASPLGGLVSLLLIGVVMLVVYVAALAWLRTEELADAARAVRARLGRTPPGPRRGASPGAE